MNSDHPTTLLLFGVPLFTLAAGLLFVAALAGLVFGVLRWKRRAGKVLVLASSLVLLLFALGVALVLLTVASGSMG